jgi:hypothetical protein
LTKPFDAEELKARLRAGQRILDLEDRLVEARESVRFQASHDLLTSLWNRGAIVELLLREVHRSRRERNCTAVMSATSTISSPTTTPSVTPPATMFFAKFPAGCALPSALRNGWPLRR